MDSSSDREEKAVIRDTDGATSDPLPRSGVYSSSQSFENSSKPDSRRHLKARHSSMIAIGGGMGTGLIIGIAGSLRNAGPGALFLAFVFMGFACWAVMSALGEMACHRPDARSFAGYASRYVDPAFGFAMSWNYLAKYLVVIANNLNACALIISYWDSNTSPAVYITVIALAILLINMLKVRVFGEIEFVLSGIKLTVVLGLIILNIVLFFGGGPSHDRYGFRYWSNGLAFKEYKATGDLGRFPGFWSCLSPALFAFIGTELVAVTVGETASPRRSLARAVRQTLFRILFCYVGGVFTVGLVVNSASSGLKSATSASTSASASPFVVAIVQAGIPILPGIINGALLVFVTSAANSDQYISSRTLHSLAVVGQAPRWLAKGRAPSGVSWRTIAVTFPFCALAYINLASNGTQAFSYLSSSVSIFGGLMWWGLLLTHIRFMAAMKVQGMSRQELPYRSPFQPYLSWTAFALVTLVLIFKGFTVFIGTFDYKLFITNYIGIPLMLVSFCGWKLVHKTKWVRLEEIDLTIVGVDELDESAKV